MGEEIYKRFECVCVREREAVNVRVYMLALTRNLEEKRERERQQVVVGDYICLFVCRMLSSVVAFLVAAEMRI